MNCTETRRKLPEDAQEEHGSLDQIKMPLCGMSFGPTGRAASAVVCHESGSLVVHEETLHLSAELVQHHANLKWAAPVHSWWSATVAAQS
jgi:hypothetical protein